MSGLLVGLIALHGFDQAFDLDGYSMGLIGLLFVLALAADLESARVGAVDVKFRRDQLAKLEKDVQELPKESVTAGQEPQHEPVASEEMTSEREAIAKARRELQEIAVDSPASAVIALFLDIERGVGRLYELLGGLPASSAFAAKVDYITDFGALAPSEGRVLLDLAALRNSYTHGRRVDTGEAARLLAVGARLLDSLGEAPRRAGVAFEARVGQVLAEVPGADVRREPIAAPSAAAPYRPDYLVVRDETRLVVEAVLGRAPTMMRGLRDVFARVEVGRRDFDAEGLIVLPIALTTEQVARLPQSDVVAIVPFPDLHEWLLKKFPAEPRKPDTVADA